MMLVRMQAEARAAIEPAPVPLSSEAAAPLRLLLAGNELERGGAELRLLGTIEVGFAG